MAEKLVLLISGANKGLGYFAVEQLARTGKYHVLLGSRDLGRAETALEQLKTAEGVNVDDISIIQFDSDSDESLSEAARTIEARWGRLDVLMLNGAIMLTEGSTREQWAKIYNTNVFGCIVAVETFLPLLRKSKSPDGKRISFSSSEFGSMELTQSMDRLKPRDTAMVNAYRSSKTALNMVAVCYASILEEDGFVVSASDPGFCATDMTNMMGYKDPKLGAKMLIQAALASKEEVHGKLVNEEGTLPW